MMTTNKLRPIHAGEVLREEFLTPLGITPHALSVALRVPATRINDVVREKRGVTADTALRLARYFDTSAEFWMNLQSVYDLKVAEKEISQKIQLEVSQLQKVALLPV